MILLRKNSHQIWGLYLIFVCSLIRSEEGSSELSSLECEYIEDISWDEWTRMGDLKCCFMQNDVEITSKGTKISNIDEFVTALDFSHNKKILMLPVDVSENFENLKAFAALECRIEQIIYENFQGMDKLKFLDLTENLIERISNNTFDDLVSLEYLALSDNKIQTMNGATFAHFTTLRKALIVNNPCIDEVFSGKCSMELLPIIVDRKCGRAKSNSLTCFRISNSTWSDWSEMGERRDCELDEGIAIDSMDFTFNHRDDSVTGLDFSFNKKISYLPVNVHESFANLQAYAAPGCAIEELFKENFEKLSILVILDLKGNKLQMISAPVFDELESLKVLRLSHNRIKFMNGEIFAPLKNLQKLSLEENQCVNRNFIEESIEDVNEDINQNCGFITKAQLKPNKIVTEENSSTSTQLSEIKKSIDDIQETLKQIIHSKN